MKSTPRAAALFLAGAVTFADPGVANATQTDPGPHVTSAQAASPCYWLSGQWGNSSNCDGKAEHTFNCNEAAGIPVPFVRLGNGAEIFLNYSGTCRTAWAQLSIPGHMPAGSNCYIKIARDSDGQTYRAGAIQDIYSAYANTAMVYDADVTSYAWSYCRLGTNGTPYSGRTRSW